MINLFISGIVVYLLFLIWFDLFVDHSKLNKDKERQLTESYK